MNLEHSPARQGENPRSAHLADDLLTGIRAIAAYTGETERRTEYLAERGLIPVFRIGKRVHARKSQLDTAYSAPGRE